MKRFACVLSDILQVFEWELIQYEFNKWRMILLLVFLIKYSTFIRQDSTCIVKTW